MREPCINRIASQSYSARGSYLPFFAMLSVALIAVIGLAIDGSRFFLSQVRLQRVVDAAIVSTMSTINKRPAVFVEETARLFAEKNLDIAGFSANPGDRFLQVKVTSGTLPNGTVVPRILDLEAQERIQLLVMPWIPFMPRNVWVAAKGEASAGRIAVVLALDTSGSMTHQPVGSPYTRIEALRIATTEFVKLLDDDDYLGIVTYDQDSAVRRSLSAFDRNAELNALVVKLNANQSDKDWIFPRFGGTAMASGLRRAREEFMNNGKLLQIPKYLVLMTDGVPDTQETWLQQKSFADAGVKDGTSCDYKGDGANPADTIRGGIRDIYQSIAQSDLVRKYNDVTVLTIGLGQENYNFCNDDATNDGYNKSTLNGQFDKPWQAMGCYGLARDMSYPPNPGDGIYVRPYLLRRIANDPVIDLPYIGLPNESLPPAQPPFPPLRPGSSITPNSNCSGDMNAGYCACIPRIGPEYPRGAYFNASRPEDLLPRFLAVFAAIKRPRLTR